MRYWSREFIGWLIVGLGILGFFLSFQFLQNQMVVEASTMTVISIFLFRGGIHLLKVAVAAQICLEADRQAAATGGARPLVEGRRAGRVLPVRR